MTWTVETLAAIPRWSREQTLALPGTSRGDLLGPWGDNLVARFGREALERVQRASNLSLASVLTKRDWIPVSTQLVVTEAIVDELLGGDWAALLPLLVEDTRKGLGRITTALVRTLGPERSLRGAAKQFREVHDRGKVDHESAAHVSRMRFSAHPLFAHPTWRLLQLQATSVVLALAGAQGTVSAEDDDETFVVSARY